MQQIVNIGETVNITFAVSPSYILYTKCASPSENDLTYDVAIIMVLHSDCDTELTIQTVR